MNSATPERPTHPKLTPSQRRWAFVALILLIFATEMVIESLWHVFGPRVKEEMAELGSATSTALSDASPWTLARDFLDGIALKKESEAMLGKSMNQSISEISVKPPPVGILPPDNTKTLASRLSAKDRYDKKMALFGMRQSTWEEFEKVEKETPEAIPPLPDGIPPPSPGAQYAIDLAKEKEREEAKKNAPLEAPSGNPLKMALHGWAGIMNIITQAAARGPLSLTFAALLLGLSWAIIRPDKGSRFWFLVLVPALAAVIAAAMYYLCMGTSMALQHVMAAPEVPTVIAAGYGLAKIPFSVGLEKWIHHGVMRVMRRFVRPAA